MTQNIVRIREGRKLIENSTLLYEGSTRPYEDPADYYPRGITLKGVRIA